MSVWDTYTDRINAAGGTKRNATLIREKRYLSNKIGDSLSCNDVLIDGVERKVTILNSDNLNEKTMLSFPDEEIRSGALVEWADNYWLVVEKDANTEVYTKTKIIQCNHLLKWVDENDIIRTQWCVVEDGTKYLMGEYEDRSFVVTRGDSRLAVTIGRNEHTVKLSRDNRFLIGDVDSPDILAYLLTKPLKMGSIYNGEGVFKFVLQEVVTTEYDNIELGIADYYKHFDKKSEEYGSEVNIDPENNIDENGRKVWL